MPVGVRQAYVRNLTAGTTILASAAANANISDVGMSGDGRYVVFGTRATNLGPTAGGVDRVFVRDTVANTTTLVSRADGATGAGGSGDSDLPQVSDDGGRVFFRSRSANLSDQDNDNGGNRAGEEGDGDRHADGRRRHPRPGGQRQAAPLGNANSPSGSGNISML